MCITTHQRPVPHGVDLQIFYTPLVILFIGHGGGLYVLPALFTAIA
jgi:hypothetical protein